jgi:2-polyprenyl-6-methoxyphenol hydroxylase-like FAD-dependent oxidoreductase
MNEISSVMQEKRALVIGGGIAGLLVARMLSEHYREVLVVDRDNWPEKPGPRAGTPQSYHLHLLQPGGKMIIQRLFPGFVDDALALGAHPTQNKNTLLINQYGSAVASDPQQDMACSRGLLEWVLRQRVQALPQVRFLTSQEVVSLETTPDRTRVTGVRLRSRGQQEEQGTVHADLVIDASGRSSKLSQWLLDMGYEVPAEDHVNASIGYSTRYYKAPVSGGEDWNVIRIEGQPEKGIGFGVIEAIENNIWAAIHFRAGGNYPSTDPEEFEREHADLIDPVMAEVLQGAEPLTQPRGFRVPTYVRRHFERMKRWPGGLLVLGDALCHFNPIYGQGMTVAAIETEVLATCLREQASEPQPDFELRAFQRMQEAIYPAWWICTIDDLRWPGVTYSGPQPPKGVALVQKCLDLHLKYATQHNTEQMQNGVFPTHFMKYWLMTTFFLAPRDLLNAPEITALLAADSSSEEAQQLVELFKGYSQPLEDVLNEIVPDISPVFAGAFAPPADEEALAH